MTREARIREPTSARKRADSVELRNATSDATFHAQDDLKHSLLGTHALDRGLMARPADQLCWFP
jgi:hypothetical protein